MKEKIKKLLKSNLFIFMLGIFACGTVGVYAATVFPSNDVTYDNTESGLRSTNVQGAIDELYNTCINPPTGGNGILNKAPIVTTGDGLYEDEYEEGKYIFKGADPNNYVTFNNDQAGWRIISINADGTIKIMRYESIGKIAWDTSGSYGNNNWNRPATLNTYLNGDYYDSLTTTAQSQIVSSYYSVGAVTVNNDDLADQIVDENGTTWYGKVALPTLSEYLRTNSNTSSCGTFSLNNDNYTTCHDTTWIHVNDDWWTLSTYSGNSDHVFFVYSDGSVDDHYYGLSYGINAIHPVITLSSEVQITGGDGSQSNPFQLSL